MTYEDEEFNRIEMESRIKQEYIRAMRKTTREEKISRPAVYEVPTETVLQMGDYIRFLENSVRELNDRLAKLEKPEQDNTYVYASSLATAIWQKHYMKESPKFALLDTTEGVLTQIDNMTCGLVREKPAQPEQEPVALQYPQKDIDWQQEQQIKAQASIPPQRTWAGLTEEERGICINANMGTGLWAMAKDIEAKLKEKNHDMG